MRMGRYMTYHSAQFGENGMRWTAGAAFSDDGLRWEKAGGRTAAYEL